MRPDSQSDEEEDGVALGGEVRDVLGDNGPALRAGGCRDVRVRCAAQASFADVDRVVTVLFPQQAGRCCREHLIDQERGHASSAWRCGAVLWLRSAIARLRLIRSLISSGCSAA